MLASVAEQASLSLTWSETPEDMFSHDEAHLITSRNDQVTAKGLSVNPQDHHHYSALHLYYGSTVHGQKLVKIILISLSEQFACMMIILV